VGRWGGRGVGERRVKEARVLKGGWGEGGRRRVGMWRGRGEKSGGGGSGGGGGGISQQGMGAERRCGGEEGCGKGSKRKEGGE